MRRESFLGLFATSSILAVCMGAGPADMRWQALVLAVFAGIFLMVYDALRGDP